MTLVHFRCVLYTCSARFDRSHRVGRKKERVCEAMNRNLTMGNRYSRDFTVRAESIYNQLKKAEKSALDVILSSDRITPESTVNSIASVAGCGDATVTRLSRKLGYSGFQDMKDSMFAKNSDITPGTVPPVSASVTDKVSAFFDIARNTLTDTEKFLDAGRLKEASLYIRNASRLLFIGSGDANLIARSGFYKFFKVGHDVFNSSDYDEQLLYVSKMSEGDVVIAISYSGISKTVLEITKRAKAHNAKVIVITAYPLSRIAKLADIVILTPAFTDVYTEVASKRIPVLAIIEILYLLSVDIDEVSVSESLRKANAELEANKCDNLPAHLW